MNTPAMNETLGVAPFAVLADIHGNALALEAVLADIRSREIETIINLGDIFYGPLDPARTAQLLERVNAITILGNQDRILVHPSQELYKLATFRRVMGALSQKTLDWLAGLEGEKRLSGGEVLCCHGAPGDDTFYLTEDISRGRPELRTCGEVVAAMGTWRPSLLLCGHSHIPRVVRCGRLTVVNPGSVGLPAYSDEEPPHVMSAGTPHARYAVVGRRHDQWSVTPVEVEYDWREAASMALANDRPDWSQWLRTGVAS